MSPIGLSIETVRWMQPGEWIFVNTSLGSQKIGIPGEVRWIRQVANTRIARQLSPVYHVGISIFVEDVQPGWDDLVAECASDPRKAVQATSAARESHADSSPELESETLAGSSD